MCAFDVVGEVVDIGQPHAGVWVFVGDDEINIIDAALIAIAINKVKPIRQCPQWRGCSARHRQRG